MKLTQDQSTSTPHIAMQHVAKHAQPQHDGTHSDVEAMDRGNPLSGALPATSVLAQQPFIQSKLEIGAANDPLEHEADAIADRVMRMPMSGAAFAGVSAQRNMGIQRKCASCEEEKIHRKPQTQGSEAVATPQLSSQIQATRGGGQSLDGQTRSFMESGLGTHLGNVRVHTGADAAQMNHSLGAKAFTVGNDIYFNQGQYQPHSQQGRHLLAHELAHTVQQGANGLRLQRKLISGQDNFGTYLFDDEKCTLGYKQDWYFQFDIKITDEEATALMAMAEEQIPKYWSRKFPLKPQATKSGQNCACNEGGVAVDVGIKAKKGKKTGKGVQVQVVEQRRGSMNPTSGTMKVEHGVASSSFRPKPWKGGVRFTLVHEFGHTIDLNDEYIGWTGFFVPPVGKDEHSVMHTGTEVRPRHYSYFGSLISLDTPGCFYSPDGIRLPAVETPVEQSTNFWGGTTAQDGLKWPGIEIYRDPSALYTRRLSNTRFMGLFYPTTGMVAFQGPDVHSPSMIGGTLGLKLGQIAHPLTVNIGTGLVTNPAKPDAGVYIPANLQVGLRTNSFEFGLRYMPMVNLLKPSDVQHLFGAGLGFEFK